MKISTVNDFIRNQIHELATIYMGKFNRTFQQYALTPKNIKVEFYHASERDGSVGHACIKIPIPYAWLVSAEKMFTDEIREKLNDPLVKRHVYSYTVQTGETALHICFNARCFTDDLSALDKIPF